MDALDTPDAPIRAVQVFTFSSPDLAGLRGELKQIKAAGFNTIILRVFKNPNDRPYPFLPETEVSGVYYSSATEPVVSDVLTPVLQEAHRQGFRVFAWITTRKSQWILNARPDWDSPRMDIESGEWITGGHLDIFRTDVEHRLTEMLVELSRTGVDGILIQDDFVSRQFDDLNTTAWRQFHGRSFDSAALTDLFSHRRTSVSYRPLFHEWARYKSRTMAVILGRLVQRVKRASPQVRIAANLYYEGVTSPHHGRQWVSQDLEDLMTVPVDIWAIMAYQQQMSNELGIPLSAIIGKLQSGAQRLRNGYLIPESRILWKFQSQDWKTGDMIPERDWKMLMNAFASSQIAVVPYRGIQSIGAYVKARNALGLLP